MPANADLESFNLLISQENQKSRKKSIFTIFHHFVDAKIFFRKSKNPKNSIFQKMLHIAFEWSYDVRNMFRDLQRPIILHIDMLWWLIALVWKFEIFEKSHFFGKFGFFEFLLFHGWLAGKMSKNRFLCLKHFYWSIRYFYIPWMLCDDD